MARPMSSTLAERLFPEVIGRAVGGGIEFAHGIGDAGFLERPTYAQVANVALRKGRHPIEGADADASLGIDAHGASPQFGTQADLAVPSSAAMSMRFICIIASKARAGSASPSSRVN